MPISGALQQMCLLLNTDTNTWELKPIKKWGKKKKKEHHCMPLQQQTVRPLVELLKGHWSKWVKLTSPAKSFPSARLHYSFHNCNQMCRLPHTVLLANLPMLALTSHLENRSLNFKEPWARLARYHRCANKQKLESSWIWKSARAWKDIASHEGRAVFFVSEC